MRKRKIKKSVKTVFVLLIVVILVYLGFKLIKGSSGSNDEGSGGNNSGVVDKVSEKLSDLGFSKSEQEVLKKELNDEEIDKLDIYDENIDDFVENKYFIYDNLERYINYSKENDYSIDEVVMYVNIGIDKEFYSDIKEVSNPSDLLVLSNKYNSLPSSYEPDDLAEVGSSGVYMRREAAEKMTELVYDALSDGVHIYMLSGYRSYDYQDGLYKNYVNMDGQEKTDTYSARPGHSEHQTGLAMDVTNEDWINDESFANTPQFEWLENNAHKYGFIMRYPKEKEFITGYIYEPWHYRYVGEDVASVIHEEGITYEEYVVKYMTSY